MLDQAQAKQIALAFIRQPEFCNEFVEFGIVEVVEFEILEDKTREEDFGWVFYYDSKEYVETGENPLAGNGGLYVSRNDGSVWLAGSNPNIDWDQEYLKRLGETSKSH